MPLSTSSAGVTVVLVTAPDLESADRLALKLLEERLVACANVLGGVRSVYRWEGELRRDDEVLMVLKTVAAAVPSLTERVAELHPYDVPEVLAVPVVAGLDAYLGWVDGEVDVAPGDARV